MGEGRTRGKSSREMELERGVATFAELQDGGQNSLVLQRVERAGGVDQPSSQLQQLQPSIQNTQL